MLDKLGFTFYPKDWWTSDTYFEFTPIQRYIYLECIFLMYSNNGTISKEKSKIERRLGMEIISDDWDVITEKFIHEDDLLSLKSVDSRMRRISANRENGKLGGRPSKEIKSISGKIIPDESDNKHFTYLIHDINKNQWKIGETKDLKKRRLSIKRPTANLVIHDFIISDHKTCYHLERQILKEFSNNIISGEWMTLNSNELVKLTQMLMGYIIPNNREINPPLEREREREIEREKESNYNDEEKQKSIYPFSSQNHFPKLSLEILKEKFEHPSEWLHAAAKKGQVQIQDLPIWVDKFFTHVTSTGKTEQTEQEIKSHFSNWLVLQDKSPKKQKENVTNVFQAALVKKHGTIETN